ncbi:TIGR04372 family glycosyltransferase [Candidatus Pelagibacter sp.]|nr:TIGR04372 family glycosyltransferase [Candidatus Pelagibacter sp.]
MSLLNFFKKNLNDIIRLGFKEFLRKLKIFFKIFIITIPIYLASFFFVLVIRIISPIIKIRVQRIISQRIGHFIAETELHLCEKSLKKKNNKIQIDLFYYDLFVSNKKIDEMIKSNLIIVPKIIFKPIHDINFLINKILIIVGIERDINNFIVPRPKCADRDVKNLLIKCSQKLNLISADYIEGEKFLNKLGIINKKFVCLAVRDDNYLKISQPRGDWKYHNFRNGNINDYLLAAEELTNRGYHVIRMGKYAKEKLKTNNPLIIDYSFSNYRNDFLDVYLGGNCKFCISTGFGFDAIPYVFRKPIAYVYTPIGYLFSFTKNSVAIFKNYYSENKKRYLNINEIFNEDLAFVYNGEILKKKKIILKENSPEEIKDLAIEMDNRLNNNFKLSINEIELQNKFWAKYKYLIKEKNEELKHGKINMKICNKFLKDNKKILIDV